MTNPLLTRILGQEPPAAYALIARQGTGLLEVLTGDVVDVDALADIPLHAPDGTPQQVLTLVPFRQVRERGYEAIDDGAPLRCLVVRDREEVDLAAATALLPGDLPALTPHGFDVSDEDYTNTVRTVLRDEIGQGEGANFVIRRDFVAQAEGSPATLALTALRRLLERERGAYWTFAVVTDGVILAGASPERHVSVKDGVAAMNPISGTYRHPKGPVDPDVFSQFLLDTKEVEELFMVVDEELKMMSEVCADGGVVEGPYLKQMSRVTHTEYILRGHTDLDVRDVLRETMFAPTVTGSPMQNACAVIARHEQRGRGYYSGVAALITPAGDGFDLDAPILIRTAQISGTGEVRVSAGATLVRHSSPEGEVAETAGKAAGLLGALGLEAAYLAGFGAGSAGASAPTAVDEYSSSASRTVPDAPTVRAADVVLADDPVIHAALQARNKMLAPFWLAEQAPHRTPDLAGRNVVVVDAEDRFTTMLAHQLRHLGMNVQVVPWTDIAESGELALPDDVEFLDLVVSGPGPGDPTDLADPRIRALRALASRRMRDQAPLVAVCLSHQAVATELGIELARLDEPRQGVQLEIDYFGTPVRIGFYNTFTARLAPGAKPITRVAGGVEAAVDPATGDVFALRGRGVATLQGHAESILSIDGLTVLEHLIRHALT